MQQPLVSVIIPIYNAEKYIEETIHSVLGQTLSDFEIIALSDGSQDSSGDLVQQLQKQDARITFITKPNTGVSDTRNIGISKARGKYIAFLDADDVWKPDNLEKKISAMRQTGRKWVFSDFDYIYEKDKHLHFERREFKPYDIIDNLLLWEVDVVPGPCSNIIAEKDFLGDDIRFDTRLSSPADRDICLQLAAKGEPFFLDEKLWLYRLHAQSMTNQNYKAIDEMKYLYKKADERKWFSSPKLRRKALSNLNLILAGMSYFFPSQRARIPGFLVKSVWYSPATVWKKKMVPLFKKAKKKEIQ
jgi:glycosyltransferase involved in cell wall biosynthesis